MNQPPADQSAPEQPTEEEVQAAIAREQEAQMRYLHDRVLQLSVTNGRLEARNAQLEAQLAGQPAT